MSTRTIGALCAAAALVSGCIEKQTIVTIPNAENIRQSIDGRLFVTGSEAFYEIRKNEDASWSAQVRDEGGCEYAGLAELHGWMFMVCMTQWLSIVPEPPYYQNAQAVLKAMSLQTGEIVEVGNLDGFLIPNGIDAMPQSNSILIADEHFFGVGGVAKAQIDFTGASPQMLSLQLAWIGNAQGVTAANGVRVIGDDVFLTDIGAIKRIPLDDAGEPQQAQTVYQVASVFDDLAPYCDGVLAADFLRTNLVYVSKDGSSVIETAPGLASPSALLTDATPLFDADTILVTERGGLFDTDTTLGDRVVSVSATALGLNCSR